MKGKHLTLEDRMSIQAGIENRLTQTEIAKSLGKNQSTISKEIYSHRNLRASNRTFRGIKYYCGNQDKFDQCKKCNAKCNKFTERICQILKKRGICNKCENIHHCYLDKYFYNASLAHKDYLYTLKDSREGFNLTTMEARAIAETIGPLLKRGQSVYQILNNHPEINLSIKSIYTYIEAGVFKDYGIDNFSLRKQVSRKPRKALKKRKEPANYEGHKYSDYLLFKKNNPELLTVEMDTVMNDTSGPYIQTFIFENTGFMLAFLLTEKTSESMSSTINYLEELLQDKFKKLFSLIITDRGSEFEITRLFEFNSQTGEKRLDLFYCDPQTPSQKPHVENNHNYLRDILPNNIDLTNLTQEKLNIIFSHINSTPRLSLNGKTPYEVFAFFYGTEILNKLKISKIGKDDVTLMPYLIKDIK